MKRLILIRHGQTDYNATQRLQGQIDIEMNTVGREQARDVARSLSGLTDVQAVYASPLSRAFGTAEAIAAHLNVNVRADERLLERAFGQWEGLTRAQIQEQWPEKFHAWVSGGNVEGVGVESRTHVGERVNAACRDFHERHADGTVLVVSHGAAISIGITMMLGLDPETFRGFFGMDNCHRAVLQPQDVGTPTGWMRLASLNIPADSPAPM